MYNFLDYIKADRTNHKRLQFDDLLLTEFNCPMQDKFQPVWADCNFFVFMLQGRKTWHTANGSFEIGPNDCLFLNKGSYLIELFLQADICVLLFFMPDTFISEALKESGVMGKVAVAPSLPVYPVNTDVRLIAFMQSALSLFGPGQNPHKSLLHLKFKELLMLVTADPANRELTRHFLSLQSETAERSLCRVMENNFHSNLSLLDFARLTNRSLSSFKRDFQKVYHTTPRKWLLKRRLEHAHSLLLNTSKNVSEVAFACGFQNVSHFSRSFKELFHKRPVQVRLVS